MQSVLDPTVLYTDHSRDVVEHDVDVVSDLWTMDDRDVYRGSRDTSYSHANVYWLYTEDLERTGLVEHSLSDHADFRILWFNENPFAMLLQEEAPALDFAITGDPDGPLGKPPVGRNDSLSLEKIEEWSPSFIIAYVVEGFPSSDERWIYRDQKINLPREPKSSRIDTAYGDDPPEGFRHCSTRALAIAECVAVTRLGRSRSVECQFFFRR
jgi:hypothetical protein